MDDTDETMILIGKEIINALGLILQKLDEIKSALSRSPSISMDSIKSALGSKSSSNDSQQGTGGQNESFF